MAGKLIDLFDNCQAIAAERPLAQGEIRSLAFGDHNTVMVLELGLQTIVSRQTLRQAEQQLAAQYHLERVCIEPRYQFTDGLSAAYVHTLYEDMAGRMPSARGLLDDDSWRCEDGTLLIPMDEVSEKHFSAALRHMEARIRRETNLTYPVRVVHVDAGDKTWSIDESEREKRLRQALKQETAAIPDSVKSSARPAPVSHAETGSVQRPRTEKVRNEDLLFGKLLQDPIISINEAIAAYDMVTVQGEIFFTEIKEVHSKKTGKDYIKIGFDMTDRTNSVRVSKFLAADKAGDIVSSIQKGLYCTVQGKMVFDTFSREMVLEPAGIVKAKKPVRQDRQEGLKRVELHLHTNMSAMDGMSSAASLLCRAAGWGHRAMAITDHGVAQAFPEALHAQEGKQKDLIGDMKIIYGIEAYYVNDEEIPGSVKDREVLKKLQRYHFIILVKNQKGLRNLYQLISKSFLDYYYKRPIMPRSELIRHREGLLFGSACEAGELFRAMVGGASAEKLEQIASFYDYLEIQPTGNNQFMIAKGIARDEEQLRDWNRHILSLADRLGKPCCATGDVHFLEPEDEAFRRILMAGQGFTDADHQAPLYLKTTDEMLKEFSYLGADRAYEVVVKNTNLVADWCDVIRPVPRENYPPHIDGAEEDLRKMCYEKAGCIYGEPLPELVRARLDRELNSIIGNGYAVMYIIAQKLVTKSLSDGYLVGSRGSVGSSLAAYMSDITEVNSLAPHYLCPDDKYIEWHEEYSCGVDLPDKLCPTCGKPLTKQGFNIPFETFLGFEGDKVPDIDLNFAGEYQSQIHWYTGEIFGHDHVFRAGTIGTIAEKTAYGFVKKYMAEHGIEATRAEENRLAAGCTGVRRTSGQHPGGVVVVPKEIEIYDVCPVQHPADDPDSNIITTHFEYHSIDANLLKLDELGHDDPTMIRHLENLTGVNAQEIPLDDPDTMSLFHSCLALRYQGEHPETDPILGDLGCVAVPEFGTKFVRGMVGETKPSTFAELVSISGLSHGTDVWLGNAAELVRSGIPLSGCICCRDDIMNYLILQGLKPKLAFKTMESVRKGKGLTEEMETAMREQNVPDWYIDSCQKIKYMFPKAHAVAYVMMAFRIAWFKVHRPLAFYSAYFSIRAKGFDASCMIRGDPVCLNKIQELQQKERDKSITAAEKEMITTLEVCHEFYRRGFVFAPMDLYQSDATTFLVTENGLIPPFTSMPGIGEQAACNIVEERKKEKFLSVEELSARCPKVSKAVVELLEQIGALGAIPKTTQMSLFV